LSNEPLENEVLKFQEFLGKIQELVQSNIDSTSNENQKSKWNRVLGQLNRTTIELYRIYLDIKDGLLTTENFENADISSVPVIQPDSTSSGLPEVRETES